MERRRSQLQDGHDRVRTDHALVTPYALVKPLGQTALHVRATDPEYTVEAALAGFTPHEAQMMATHNRMTIRVRAARVTLM